MVYAFYWFNLLKKLRFIHVASKRPAVTLLSPGQGVKELAYSFINFATNLLGIGTGFPGYIYFQRSRHVTRTHHMDTGCNQASAVEETGNFVYQLRCRCQPYILRILNGTNKCPAG